MSKQLKQLIVICILLVVAIVSYLCLQNYNAKKDSEKEKSAKIKTVKVVNLDKKDVVGFSYVVNNETLSFKKQGKKWICENDTSKKISKSAVETIIESAVDLVAENEVTDLSNEKDFGLDNPENVITLVTKDKTIKINIGNHNDMLKQYYARIDGKKKVYMLSDSIMSTFQTPLVSLEDTGTVGMTSGTEATK